MHFIYQCFNRWIYRYETTILIIDCCIGNSYCRPQAYASRWSAKDLQRQAKKEAKKLKKEGWETFVRDAPLDVQLMNSWMAQLEYDAEGNPLYITASNMQKGMSVMMAKQRAMAELPLQAIQQAQAEVSARCEASLTATESTIISSILQSIYVSVQDVPSKMLAQYQRRESDRTYSVCIHYAYLRKPLVDAFTQQLLQQLEQENPALKAKVQEIFNNN